MSKPSDFVLCKVDSGRCSIVYTTRNSLGEQIYYAIVEGNGLEFFRCSQPFRQYGEYVYEPQSKAHPKNPIRIELPKGNSHLESLARTYINNHSKMLGF